MASGTSTSESSEASRPGTLDVVSRALSTPAAQEVIPPAKAAALLALLAEQLTEDLTG